MYEAIQGIKTGTPDGEAPERMSKAGEADRDAARHRRVFSRDSPFIREHKRRIGDKVTPVVVSNARIGARIMIKLDGTSDLRRSYDVGIVSDFVQPGNEQPSTWP